MYYIEDAINEKLAGVRNTYEYLTNALQYYILTGIIEARDALPDKKECLSIALTSGLGNVMINLNKNDTMLNGIYNGASNFISGAAAGLGMAIVKKYVENNVQNSSFINRLLGEDNRGDIAR